MSIEELVEDLHKGQKRKTGEKYTSHLYAVRDILKEVGVTEKYILDAALLHDVIEDTTITKEEISLLFGKTIAEMVATLSKDDLWSTSYGKLKSYIWQLHNIAIQYPEIILIKMADRLHNIRTIKVFSENKKREYIAETKNNLFPIFKKSIKYAPEKKPFLKLRELLEKELDIIALSLKKNGQ